MRPRLAIFALAAIMVPLLSSAQTQGTNDDSVVHGTINVSLGNKNGVVVLTDSMITAGSRQRPEPAQKLFKLDDHTVCSIAGFVWAAAVSGPTAPVHAELPELNTSTSAIIHEYIRQSAGQPPQSIVEKLRTLAFLMNRHLSAIANVRNALGNPTPIDGYRFQLIVAGYDLDDKPKIGRIVLETKSDRGSLSSDIEEGEIVPVGEKLVWRLNGMPDVAARILQHQETSPEDEVIQQYATALRNDSGASLTVPQMTELAKRLALYTSRKYREVGGPNQIAILEPQHTVKIEQQVFPDPPKPLVGFSLVVNSTFSYSSIGTAPGVPVIFVRCHWRGMKRELDGNFFIGNDFTDSVLTYSGGPVNLGNTNQVTNSVLLVLPLLRTDDQNLVRLARAFPWARVQFDFTGSRL